jgi:hypothetical protein
MILSQALIDELEIPTLPPTDLKSVGCPSESDYHLHQRLLLLSGLRWLWAERPDKVSFFLADGEQVCTFQEAAEGPLSLHKLNASEPSQNASRLGRQRLSQGANTGQLSNCSHTDGTTLGINPEEL